MTDTQNASSAAIPPKADPETLVLRGAPGRVVRFRRGAVIAIAALGSTAIVGAAWVALKPATFRVVAGSDRGDAGAKVPADALADAPKSYGDVPQLGPPLPGDLGRPILDHQRSLGAPLPPAGPDQAAQAAEAERLALAAERKAARESGVMMQISGNRSAAASAEAAPASPATSEGEAKPRLALDPERDPNGQQRKADFLSNKEETEDINPR